MFAHQTKFQRRLLNRYGNAINLLDATYKTTKYAIPLFFLAVKTNVDYQVFAFSFMHKKYFIIPLIFRLAIFWQVRLKFFVTVVALRKKKMFIFIGSSFSELFKSAYYNNEISYLVFQPCF